MTMTIITITIILTCILPCEQDSPGKKDYTQATHTLQVINIVTIIILT